MDTCVKRAALWQCDQCGLWWCSQPKIEPTMFMLTLPIDLFEELGWENFRGWRLGGAPHVATCGGCGEISPGPFLGSAAAGPALRLRLSALLQPEQETEEQLAA